MDSFGRVVAILLTIILIFLVPLRYVALNQDAILDSHVHSETAEFTEHIMYAGAITIDEYTDYLRKLDATNQIYDIEIIHSKPRVSKEAGDLPVNSTFHRLLQTGTTRIMATHSHTADCYDGDAHTHSGYGGSCYTYEANGSTWVNHTHNTYCYSYSTIKVPCDPQYYNGRSKVSATEYMCYWSCPRGNSSSSGHRSTSSSCSLDHSSKNCLSKIDQQVSTLNCTLGSGYWETNYVYVLSCGKTSGAYYNGNIQVSPVCNTVITGISATKSSQTVIQGDPIIATAIGTYLDGHTGTVNCTSNYNGNIGIQNVTLTYSGKVGNAKTLGTRTAITTVTTTPRRIATSLSVVPSSFSVLNGTEPDYTVKVHYDDGSNQVITTGYTKTGFTKGAGTKTVTFTYTENGKTVDTSIIIEVKRNTKVCFNGHTYELDDFDTDLGCPVCESEIKSISVAPQYITVKQGEELNIVVTAAYKDGHTKIITNGWTSNFDSNKVGNQLVTVSYEGKSVYLSVVVKAETNNCSVCGLEYNRNEDGSDPGCPVCSTLVVEISASPGTQMVQLGEALDLTIVATFKDGHSEEVTDWTSNFNSYRYGIQEVTIYYGAVTTSVLVKVESDSKTICPICFTVYNPYEYPNGCPYCSKTVVGIEASLRNGGYQVRIGSELNLSVILEFKDGHREFAYSGWAVEGYQADTPGTQILTVNYDDFQTTLTIEVVNTLAKTICVNGHVYFLNADGSNPGCPYCDNINGNSITQEYFDCIYTDDIIKKLYETGIYALEQGDYITVTVIPKGTSVLDKLQGLFLYAPKPNKQYSYGGQINGKYI
jgi:Zn finger protein HypA/HybF involved in hydrogenase expression